MPSDRTSLVLFGGGPRPESAIRRFVERAGGPGEARVLVVCWASSVPELVYESIGEQLGAAHPRSIESSLEAPRTAAERDAFVEQLARATGVFFSGGDQNRTMRTIEDFDLAAPLRERFESGTPFAGTSAGMAIMSPRIIAGDIDPARMHKDKVRTREGLGLLPGTIVDQHFLVRQRHNRLFALVLDQPDLLGVGVDEGAALTITSGRDGEVHGGQVLFVDASGGERSFWVDVLDPGERYDLLTRERVASVAPLI